MKKYYLSHIDFSELINVTTNEEQLSNARERMTELGLLTEKGNPATAAIGSMVSSLSKSFFLKLQRRLRNRSDGISAVRDTLKKLYDRKEYYGFYLYLSFLYGFLEWQVPSKLVLLPAVPEALRCYCTEFMLEFNKFIEENADVQTEDNTQNEKEIAS
jgi:hypothetical protein